MAPKRKAPKGDARRKPPKRNTTTKARTALGTVGVKDKDGVVRTGAFRFLDLPSELRREVYHHLLPHNRSIKFIAQDSEKQKYEETGWDIRTFDGTTVKSDDEPLWEHMWGSKLKDVSMSYFLVSKFVTNEVKAVLYGENTFLFKIDGDSHQGKSLSSPRIFGPLGDPRRLPVLRELRSIRIVLRVTPQGQRISHGHLLDDYEDIPGIVTHWTAKRHSGRLAYFLRVLKDHSDDENQKSLLERLEVNLPHNPGRILTYSLESLTALCGIKEVEIKGANLPDWYRKCLQLCVQGEGGALSELDYPLIKKYKPVATYSKKYKEVWATTKLWHQPVYNWEEFTDRNGIDRQEDNFVDLTAG